MNNIIFDGNYMLYKTLFVFRPEGKKRVLESTTQQEQFIRKVATDVAFTIRQFGSPNRIIFTVDSKSWRNNIQIEENEGYKAQRTKADDIDWDNFYKCFDEFIDIIEKQGIIISKIDSAEGDDLMYLWSKELLSKNENAIIITGDKDMHQLVNTTSDNFTVVYNPNSVGRKIYGQDGFSMWINEEAKANLFDTSTFINTPKDMIKEALRVHPLEELNPIDFLKIKILVGDDGDNVPSVFHWPSKNGKTTHRITPKRAEKIIEHINENHIGKWDVTDYPDLVDLVCEGIKKVSKKDAVPEEIQEKLKRNITLMMLSDDTIPPEIIENFKEHSKEVWDLKTLPGRTYDISTLLKGTRFFKEPKSTTTSLFGALDRKH